MELIHHAPHAPEIVIQIDLHWDLQAAGLLLDNFDPGPLSDDEYDRREAENARRVGLFEAAYLETLRKIGTERNLAIWTTTHPGDVTRTVSDATRGGDVETVERAVWQEAHDRTPAEPLWAEQVQA